ncbi:G2 and S phase-expressed protein 1 [Carlito syrichta]|uniref:G2 and S phase-expressed protein 1 n=1 Tax=Carlito syrichta TaxID=1868482 RepID=A0A1U7SGM2_CARSF|nr:G2 and S phase-expressed protein 1 [Carlito syrichta]
MEGDEGCDMPSTSQAGEVKTDVPQKEDILLLADEKFDFDLSLSSSSANEDDEVFFGPCGHRERCIAASLESNNRIPDPPPLPASDSHFTWSPLTGEKFVEVYKEAHLLALQIENNSRSKAAQDAKPKDPWSQDVERFIQESKLKINLFEKEKEMKKSPKSLKRETYCLADSPLMGPPLGKPPLPDSSPALPSSPAQAALTQMQGPPHSARPLSGRSSSAHPLNQAALQKKFTNKLQLPRASAVRGRNIHMAMEKPKKEIPASPSRVKILTEKESHKDVLPDKPVLDAASVPATGSHLVQGKRSLPVLNKLGPKKTLLRPPGSTSSLTRKPSSSGSVSKGASTVCVSPAEGKAKSSEFSSIPASNSRPLSKISKSGRTGPATQRQSLPAGPVGASCKQAKWADTAELTAEPPTAPPAASPTQPHTPESGGQRLNSNSVLSESSQLNKTRSIRRRDSYLNSKTKIMPTSPSQFKIPKFSIGESPDSTTPRLSRAQRPQSCTSVGRLVVHSTPARHSSEPAPQSLVSSSWTPLSTRRVSALPTPASRRLSSIPLITPKTMPRAVASPLCVPARQLSSEPRKKSTSRTEPTRESNRKIDSRQADLSPDGSFSPPSNVPQALNFSPEKNDLTCSKSTTAEATLDEAKPCADTPPKEALLIDIKLDPLAGAPKTESKPLTDLLLIDFCSTPEATVAVRSESRPLIDLMMNTPDMITNVVAKPLPAVGQLIDLGSPLILLSPEADKENVDSPLLKF